MQPDDEEFSSFARARGTRRVRAALNGARHREGPSTAGGPKYETPGLSWEVRFWFHRGNGGLVRGALRSPFDVGLLGS